MLPTANPTKLTEEQVKLIKVEGKILNHLTSLFEADIAAGALFSRFCNSSSWTFELSPSDKNMVENYMGQSKFHDAYHKFLSAFYTQSKPKDKIIGTILTVLDTINWESMKNNILKEDWAKLGVPNNFGATANVANGSQPGNTMTEDDTENKFVKDDKTTDDNHNDHGNQDTFVTVENNNIYETDALMSSQIKSDELHSKDEQLRKRAVRLFRRHKAILFPILAVILYAFFVIIIAATHNGNDKNSTWDPKFSTNADFTTFDPTSEDFTTIATTDSVTGDITTACPPLPANRQSVNRSIRPDFNKVLDLCHSDPVELIIHGNTMPSKISCPEKVHALEIISSLSESQMEYLFSSFCSVTNITFLGSRNCGVAPYLGENVNKNLRFMSPNLISLSFEDMKNCGVLFEKFVTQFHFPNLEILSFTCVSFLISEFSVVDKIIANSRKLSQVHCSDRDMCRELVKHVNSTGLHKTTTIKANCELEN